MSKQRGSGGSAAKQKKLRRAGVHDWCWEVLGRIGNLGVVLTVGHVLMELPGCHFVQG